MTTATEPLPAPGAPPPAARERLAAIDVGSNSIRLLVAEYDPASGLTVVDEVKEQPRLAAGIAATGRLDPAAIQRALEALRRMRDVCLRRGVRRIAAVATAAVREAANGPTFIRLVREELDIPLRVIDAQTEANLSFRSVAHHFRLERGRTVIADIGGGSLELISAVDGLVGQSKSLPFGAVRMTETYLTGRRDLRKEIAEMRTVVRKQLRKSLPVRGWTASSVIGSGGTFTNLGRMAVARRGQPASNAVHGVTVTTAEVEQLLEWLTTMPPERRRQVPGLNPMRADIILAGLAVTVELLERVDARELTISAFGLREGLLLEMAGADARPAAADPLRLVREFAERCHSDRRHVEAVRSLALQLFDQLARRLKLDANARWVLEVAGLLHDVGQLVSYPRHHKHSYELIMHADRLDLSTRDRQMVALVSRYHRKSGPRKKHAEFAALDEADRALVLALSGILRVADGLDRGHTAIVEEITTDLDRNRLIVNAVSRDPGADLSLECWGAQRKADVLAKVLKREIVVRPLAGKKTGLRT